MKSFFTLVSILVVMSPVLVSAQGAVNSPGSGAVNPPVPSKIDIPNPLKNKADNLPQLLNLLIDNIILPLGGAVVVLMIIYSGFLYVTAQGNPEKIKKANTAFLYAAIGAVILLGARTIAIAIDNTITQLK
jgi:hypothetical protein